MTWVVPIEYNSAHLDRVVANDTVVELTVKRALRLLIMLVTGGCVRVGSETGQGAIHIVPDASVWSLISDNSVNIVELKP